MILRQCSVREPHTKPMTKLHVHHAAQLYVCFQGHVTINIEGQDFPLRSSNGVLVPPGQGRRVEPSRQPSAYIFAIFDSPSLDLDLLYRRPLRIDNDLRSDFSALVEELRSLGGPDSPLLQRTLLLRLILGFRRQVLRKKQARQQGTSAQIVQQVERVLEHNLHRSLSRAEIAEAVQISEAHLARLFKASTGQTVHARLTELRVEQAKSLLRDSSLSCGQIAQEIGIASISHFTKLFRQLTGHTPSAYRQMIENR